MPAATFHQPRRFMVRSLLRRSVFGMLLALCCASSLAQAPVALNVSVTDENAVALRSVRVSLRLAGNAAASQQESDFSGRCRFTGLTPGAYLLHAEKEGFYAVTQTVQVDAANGMVEVELHHL